MADKRQRGRDLKAGTHHPVVEEDLVVEKGDVVLFDGSTLRVGKRARRAILGLLALVALAGDASAFPQDRCSGARDCSGGVGPSYCLADGPSASSGRCVAGKILP